ncbi:MAG TPA: DUF460 domain-containing protein, partial [Methanocellaceae archaeon]
ELKHELKHLEWRIYSQDRTIEGLRNKGIDEARKNKEVTIRDSEIGRLRKDVSELKKRNSELQSNLDRLKQIRALELKGDRSPVKIIESISKDAIAACDHRFGIKAGDIIFARDAGGGVEAASILIERGVKAVIIGTPMSHLAEEKFLTSRLPVLKKEDVPLKFVDGYAVMDPVRLEAAIVKWQAYVEGLEKQHKEQKFLGIIDEYKAKRAREYRKNGVY